MNRIRTLLSIDLIHSLGFMGGGINVAVLDTGVYLHRDLAGKIIFFKDFTRKSAAPYDNNSHGTHVCGIICGSGYMSGGLYKGMSPHSGLVVLKVLDSAGRAKPETIMEGLSWILKNYKKYKIRIVNISIGTASKSCKDESGELVRMVNNLWESGIVVVSSAGNDGPDPYTITIPGISRKIITVGTNDIMSSIGPDGHMSTTYSSAGPTHCEISKPDIVAPGSNIHSCCFNNSYVAKSGTSMSTPIVSGAAAIILSYNPSLTNNEVKKLFCDYADDLNLPRNIQGCGLLNISKLFL